MRTRSKTSRDAPIAAQVRGYLAAQPAKQRRYLKQIRDVIRKSAPGATSLVRRMVRARMTEIRKGGR